MLSVHLGFCHLIFVCPCCAFFVTFSKTNVTAKYRIYSNSFPHLYPLLLSLLLFFFSSLFSSFSLLLGEKLSAETSSRPRVAWLGAVQVPSRFEIAGPGIGGVTLIVFRWDTFRASSSCEGEVRSLWSLKPLRISESNFLELLATRDVK